eukprot:574149-Pyramimonas_sp.AAC.1
MSGLGGRACGPPLHPDPPCASEGRVSAPSSAATDRSRLRGLRWGSDSLSCLLEASLDGFVVEVSGLPSV